MTSEATTERVLPWQKITNEFPEGASFNEAIEQVGLDYEVQFRDLMTTDGKAVGRWRATVRTDTEDVLGIVGSRYTIVQNKDAFGFLKDIVDSGDIRPIGAGYWRLGARPWIQARLPEDIVVNGDREIPFIFGATSHDGGLPVTVSLSAIRVVCQNTYAANLSAPRRFQVRHLASVDGRIGEARRVLDISFAYFKEYAEAMNELAALNMSEDQFKHFVWKLFPIHEKASDEQKENIQKRRAGLLGVYLNSPTVPRGTKYGALQAVTEWYDHVKNGQRKKGTREAIERKSEDILMGEGVSFKDKAVELIRAAR